MLLAAENHRLVQKEMETEKMKAIMKASQTVEVNNIEMKRQLTIKHFEQRISEINGLNPLLFSAFLFLLYCIDIIFLMRE